MKPKVVYDDGCPTCRVGMHIAERLGSGETLDIVGMHTEEGKRLIDEHRLNMTESAYVIHDGKISDRAAFMHDVFSCAGIAGKLISLPFRVPIVGNALYSLLALHRKHVTTSEH